MSDLMTRLVRIFRPKIRQETLQAVLDRDPDLRRVRREQRAIETRVKALEVQSRVRARRH